MRGAPMWVRSGLRSSPAASRAADDVDGSVAAIGGTVGDGVGLAVEFDTLGLEFELVAEQAKQRRDPVVAGFGGGRGLWPERFELALKDAPVVLRIGPGTGDFVLDLGASRRGRSRQDAGRERRRDGPECPARGWRLRCGCWGSSCRDPVWRECLCTVGVFVAQLAYFWRIKRAVEVHKVSTHYSLPGGAFGAFMARLFNSR